MDTAVDRFELPGMNHLQPRRSCDCIQRLGITAAFKVMPSR